MRRILPLIVIVTVLGSLFAAAAWARSDQHAAQLVSDAAASRAAAPFAVPSVAPHRDTTQHGFIYDYRSAASIGAEIDAKAARGTASANDAASATIRVTATVLPCVTVSLDSGGAVTKLVTNTPERDARNIVFVAPRALDGATWSKVSDALAHAAAGTGTVFGS